MKFDENYDFRNIFNNIRSSSSYHGYPIARFQSESIQQNAIQKTLGTKRRRRREDLGFFQFI